LADFHRRAGWRRVQRSVLYLARVGRNPVRNRLPDRPPVRPDDGGGDLRVADGARLHRRIHGRRPGIPAFLCLHRPLYVLDADAGDGEQFPAAFLRLGGGGPGVVSSDRLLVYATERDLREPEGVPRKPGRRFRLPARRSAGARVFRHARLRSGFLPSPVDGWSHDRGLSWGTVDAPLGYLSRAFLRR